MRKLALSLALSASFAFSAVAAETPAEDVSTGNMFVQVCQSKAKRSEKLETACKANEAPEAVKAGDRFKNVGIGAEINTLFANIAFFK